MVGGLFFTIYLRFINFRGFKHAIDIVRGKFAESGDPGQISQFQALTTAVSGTVEQETSRESRWRFLLAVLVQHSG